MSASSLVALDTVLCCGELRCVSGDPLVCDGGGARGGVPVGRVGVDLVVVVDNGCCRRLSLLAADGGRAQRPARTGAPANGSGGSEAEARR